MSEPIHILQLLCPRRHAILAAAYDPADRTQEQTREFLEKARAALHLHPWCGLCHSKELHYEDQVTEFATIEEARPTLEEMQRANLETRALFNQSQGAN